LRLEQNEHTFQRCGSQIFFAVVSFRCISIFCGPLRFGKVFRLARAQFWLLLNVSTSTVLARSKLQVSNCHQLLSPKSTKQKTCQLQHEQKSDKRCGTIKLNNDPHITIKNCAFIGFWLTSFILLDFFIGLSLLRCGFRDSLKNVHGPHTLYRLRTKFTISQNDVSVICPLPQEAFHGCKGKKTFAARISKTLFTLAGVRNVWNMKNNDIWKKSSA